MKKMRAWLASSMALAIAMIAVLFVAAAQHVSAQAVAKSFIAEGQLRNGMIVTRSKNDDTKVTTVNQNNAGTTYGVVVQPNDTPLTLSKSDAGQQVYVASVGTYRVLVSDQNGAIKKGDYIVVSALEGVGMKVDPYSDFVIGKAAGNFDGKTNVLSSTVVKDSAGHERTVKLGLVSVDITIGKSPVRRGNVSQVPGTLQRAADSIAGKPVSPVRVYMSMLVGLISAAIASSVLYAGVRGSVISLGRNPLARRSIFRNFFQIMLIGLIILVVGLFAVYLLLKL